MGRTGSEIVSSLVGKSYADREAMIRSAVIDGFEHPEWVSGMRFMVGLAAVPNGPWKEVVSYDKDSKGVAHKLILRVAPRYFEVGTNEDPVFMPMWPSTAQDVATAFNAILPSEKIVDLIWQNAAVQLPIGPPPGFKIPGKDMEEVPSWAAHNAIVQRQVPASQSSWSNVLMAGGKKDLVVGPGLDGAKVAIYSSPFGGQGRPLREVSTETVPNPWQPGTFFHPPLHQPYSTIHDSRYSDYSHGLRLISKYANLDGKEVELDTLFTDPVLSSLVSDQGPFYPSFPNKGAASRYGIEEQVVQSGPNVDPTEAVAPPSMLTSILPIPRSESEKKRMLMGGAAGLGVSLLAGLSIPWSAGVVLLGSILGRRWGE